MSYLAVRCKHSWSIDKPAQGIFSLLSNWQLLFGFLWNPDLSEKHSHTVLYKWGCYFRSECNYSHSVYL